MCRDLIVKFILSFSLRSTLRADTSSATSERSEMYNFWNAEVPAAVAIAGLSRISL